MRPSITRLTLFTLVTVLTSGCGEGTIQFGGGGNENPPDTIVVEGNIRDVNPQVAGADTVVFVYTNLEDPGVFSQYKKQRSVALASDAEPANFRITQIESGNLTIVFLQDHASNPDGTIDTGDPYAILSDPNHVLRDAQNGETFEIADVDIDFQRETAEAVTIRSVRGSGTAP